MRYVFAIAALLLTGMVCAQQGVQQYQEYEKRIRSSEMVGALKSDLFGDNVSLYNGATEFTTTDIDLPGNGPSVKLSREFKAEVRQSDVFPLSGFADWDIDVPYIKGTFDAAYGWNGAGAGSTQRCSTPAYPKVDQFFNLQDVWSGTNMHIPGEGNRELLWLTAQHSRPSDGGAYYWGTRDQHRFRCLSSIPNYPGEGFVAVDTNGTTYTFNIAIERGAGFIEKRVSEEGTVKLFRKQIYLMASRVQDRHGNYVDYQYTSGRLTRIISNDGRSIDITYNANGAITRAVANGREWKYAYTANGLSTVTLPDLSRWQYQSTGNLGISSTIQDGTGSDWRCLQPLPSHGTFGYTITHPSGAIGQFDFSYIEHGRSGTPASACALDYVLTDGMIRRTEFWYLHTPDYYYTFSLQEKKITGPNIPESRWQYSWTGPATRRATFEGSYCTSCDPAKSAFVTQPDGTVQEHRFGALWNFNEGRLLGIYTRNGLGTVVKSEVYDYVSESEVGLMPFSAQYGLLSASDDPNVTNNRPQKKIVISQDGDVAGPSYYVPPSPEPPCTNDCPPPPPPPPPCDPATNMCEVPMVVVVSSAMASASDSERDMATASTNTTTNTVTGLPATTFTRQINSFDQFASPTSVTKFSSLGYTRTDTTVYEPNLNKWVLGLVKTVTNTDTAKQISKTDYDPVTALPLRNYSFGQTQPDNSFTYLPDGNVSTIKDALNRTMTLSDYYRGVPRLITFPDSTTLAATVNATGTIASSTDQLGSVTQYTYDVMDRMAGITPPTGDTVAWVGATQTFTINTVAAYGLPVGHWKQTISKGNYRKEIYFNAMWQPVVTREYDNSNIAGTQRFTRMAYDTSGRPVFTSYPGTTDALINGVRTEYDALGRVTKTMQDSELGVLNTTTEYLTGFQTRVTNPRGFSTTTSYQVFDQPDTSRPEIIVAPEGQTTTILRNVFGNPLNVTRSGIWNGSPLSSTRSYVYDAQQRLCKRVEPETGATIMDYDVVGNLQWSAQGSALTSNNCDRTSVATIDKTVRSYDTLSGRLLAVDVPGTTNDLSYSYFNNGTLKSLISGTNRWDYTYNKLRLPVTETLTIDSRVKTLTHAYNNMAQESSLTYPSGLVVATTPNALGQATQAGTFATGVNYHAMGGMSIFNYGNGIVHRMTPNTRMLPTRSWDMNGAVAILDDTYVFDANGNVASITDGTAGAGGNRSMTYDNADRLIQTNAPSLAWMSNTFSYDALDNIRTNTLGGRSHNYKYNVTTKRLDQLTLPNASVARNLAYDTQGNVTTNGAQSYVFDKANRMQSVTGKESYQYDGHGRRVKITRTSDGKISYPIYSLEGKIVADEDQRSNKTIDYVYLNGSLVAKRSAAIGSTAYITSYQHTDSLGSPVAESDAAKTVTYIKRYTPYGEPSDQNYVQGPGFTGHVTDAATGLTYAQQRYYDPILGRFLSVDPVETDPNSGASFNRYNYANNNPYRFTDPDGRKSKLAWIVKLTADGTRKVATVSKEQAVRAARSGNKNIQVESPKEARKLANAVAGGKGVIKEEGHKLRDPVTKELTGKVGLPHYHTADRNGAHIFFGKLSIVATIVAGGLDKVAEAAEYVGDPGPKPATTEDLQRTNVIINKINDATGLDIPKLNTEVKPIDFQQFETKD